jgi:hypothetical protein
VVLLAVYALGLVVFPVKLALISDEAQYVRQAMAYAQGQTRVAIRDVKSGTSSEVLPSPYPPGTALLEVPFVRLGGWRAAPWASMVSLGAMLWLTATHLRRSGYSTWYAALNLLYLPAAVLGRSAMSDIPSGAIIALSWWFFAREPRSSWNWMLAGFFAGASALFRDANLIFFIPFFIGTVARREAWQFLLASGLVGAALRPIAAQMLQGRILGLHALYYPFSTTGLAARLELYVLALAGLCPAGLVAVLGYRGCRWPELVGTVSLALLFFGLYGYSGQNSGLVQALVVGPRYFIPLMPLVAVAVAWWAEKLPLGGQTKRLLEAGVLGGALLVAGVVHPALWIWGKRQESIVEAIYRDTSSQAVIVTELAATAKYLNGLYGDRTVIGRDQLSPDELVRIRERQPVQLLFLDRSEAPFWKAMAAANEAFVTAIAERCELLLTTRKSLESGERLRIWDVQRCER